MQVKPLLTRRHSTCAVGPGPLEAGCCPHGDDHPDERIRRWNQRGFATHLRHLYASDLFPSPEAALSAEVWVAYDFSPPGRASSSRA